jgi:hypothetical protein
MVNYGEGFKRPFQDGGKFALGTILAMIPIINFIAVGYALKCAKMTMGKKKRYALPEWDDIGSLFAKGLGAFVIGLVYALPGLLFSGYVFTKAVLAILYEDAMTSPELIATLLAENVILLLVGVILLLFAGFLSPLAIMNYVKYDKFGAGFNFSEILNKISGTYLLTWILVVAFYVIVTSVMNVIPIPLVGGASLASFMITIVSYTWFAEAYMS